MNAGFPHHAVECGQPRKCVLQSPGYRRRGRNVSSLATHGRLSLGCATVSLPRLFFLEPVRVEFERAAIFRHCPHCILDHTWPLNSRGPWSRYSISSALVKKTGRPGSSRPNGSYFETLKAISVEAAGTFSSCGNNAGIRIAAYEPQPLATRMYCSPSIA
jgi:hypothetical protein